MPRPFRSSRSRRQTAKSPVSSSRPPSTAPPARVKPSPPTRPHSFMQSLSSAVAQGVGFGFGNAIVHEAVREATRSDTSTAPSPMATSSPPVSAPAQTDDVDEKTCDAALRAYAACMKDRVDHLSTEECHTLGDDVSRCLERFPHLQA